MPRRGSVNYHVHKPERQAFEIDSGGIVGNLVSPELAVTEIDVRDVRAQEAQVSFQADSVGFLKSPTKVVDFENQSDWQKVYDAELEALLVAQTDAKEVLVFDHTVRTDDPNATRKPARNVHSDYSPDGAKQRLIDLIGEERAAEWEDGHYAFINVWRPIGHFINSAPLAFLRPSSVAEADWILLDLIYPDRVGQIMGIAPNAEHEWVYQSKMEPDEIAFFNIYDNRGLASIAHSAIDLVEDPNVNTIRQSIESRTLVRY